jgi:hypothetical protein
MSRSIFRARAGIITGDLLQSPVASISALRLVSVQDIDDGQLIYVKAVDRIFGFKRGDTTADDGAAVIAPTYNASAGRWHAVSSIAEEVAAADVSIADSEDFYSGSTVEEALAEVATALSTAVVNLNDLGDVDVTGAVDTNHLVYDQPSSSWKPSKKTMLGGKSFSGLSTLDLIGVSERKVGSPQELPFVKGMRVHVTVSAVLGVVDGGSLVPPPNNQVWIGFNFQNSSGVAAATFVTGNLADLTRDKSEITAHVTFLVGDATSANPAERNILASGICLQDIPLGSMAPSVIRRLNRTPPPASTSTYDGTGLQAENISDVNKYLQVSVTANNSSMTLTNHYTMTIKSVTIDFAQGS